MPQSKQEIAMMMRIKEGQDDLHKTHKTFAGVASESDMLILRRKQARIDLMKKKLEQIKKDNEPSDIYKQFVKRFPDSRIAKDYHKGFPHGGFGSYLKDGDIERAVGSADLENTLRMKKLGVERMLDNPADRKQFEAHANFAVQKGIKV